MRKRPDVDKLGLICDSLHGRQSLNDAVIGRGSRIDLPVSWWIAVEPPRTSVAVQMGARLFIFPPRGSSSKLLRLANAPAMDIAKIAVNPKTHGKTPGFKVQEKSP